MEVPAVAATGGRRWRLAVIVLAAWVVSCSPAPPADDQVTPQEKGKTGMAKKDTRYPNYEESDESPQLGAPGVAIRLDPPEHGDKYGVGQPIILRGAVGANAQQHAQSHGEVLIKTLVKAVRRKDDAEHVVPVRASDNKPLEDIPEPADPDAYEVYAWFNIDIHQALSLPDEPGEYTVQASFFDFVSEKLEFEIEFGAGKDDG